MKWILTVSTILFFGLSAWGFIHSIRLEEQNGRLAGHVARAETKNTELRDSLAMPFTKEIIYHARDKRTKDFFTFMKVGRGYNVGYEIITDLKGIDRTAFDFVYWVCVDSNIPIDFLMETWFAESRFGLNIAHKLNSDGSKDGGNFGKNYKDPRMIQKSTAYTDVYDFIKQVRLFQRLGIPRKDWRAAYSTKDFWKQWNKQDLKRFND